jgi:hypothetical protein
VGARHREQDISYEDHRNAMKLKSMDPPRDPSSGPFGPTTLPPTTDLRPKGPKRTGTNDSESRTGLLTHQQSVPKINVREPSPYDSSREPSPHRQGTDPYRQDAGPFRDPPSEGTGGFKGDAKPPPGNPYYVGNSR